MTYSAREVAKMVGTTDTSIHNWIKSGLIPDRRVGGISRFTEEDVEKIKELAKVKKEERYKKKERPLRNPNAKVAKPELTDWESFVKKVERIYATY